MSPHVDPHAESCRVLLESARDFAYLFDLDGRLRYGNAPLLALWGITLDQAIGKDFFELGYPAALAARLQRQIQQVVQTRGVVRDETPYTSAQGVAGHYEYILSPVLDADGSVEAVAGTTREITERKQLELDLLDARKRLDMAMRAGEMGTWVLDIENDVVHGDTNLSRLFAVPAAALRTGKLHQYLAAIHPDDRKRVVEAISTAVKSGSTYEAEYRVRGDDRERWVVARGLVERDKDGRALRLPGVVLDITSRKRAELALRESEERFRALSESALQSEQRMRGIFSQVTVGIVQTDLTGRFTDANERFCQVVGRSPEELYQLSMVDITESAHAAESARLFEQLVSTGRPFVVEKEFVRASGERVWASTSVSLVTDGAGKPVSALAVTVDISARKRAEDALREVAEERERLLSGERTARGEAERTSRVKDEFLATLSHELRTPLNAILGWSQIVKQRAADPQEVARGLAVIERNARAQAQIIEDLLDMSRIVSGKIRLDVAPVDFPAILQSAVETAKPAADAKLIELSVTLAPLEGLGITGDVNRLRQVLWNLLSNAVKFTPRGGRVQVRVEHLDEHIEVAVVDSGEGIAPDFLGQVFDRFRQADASTTRRHGGLGLGLAIVKQLVELHGGSVRVTSAGLGRGSAFIVTLPLRAHEPDEELDADVGRKSLPPARSLDEHAAELDGLRVLVVDDEPDARGLVQRLLEDNRAHVTAVGSVAEAVQQLESARFELVISDIGMPLEDGYALARRLRSLTPEQGGATPAVALTAYARSEDRVAALRAGFQMHLVKPIEPTELLTVVASLTGRPMRGRS